MHEKFVWQNIKPVFHTVEDLLIKYPLPKTRTQIPFVDPQAVFPGPKLPLDSTMRLNCIVSHWRICQGKPLHFSRLYPNGSIRVNLCINRSFQFTMRGGVRQGCPLSAFLSNFAFGMPTELVLSYCENSGIDVSSERRLPGLQHVDARLAVTKLNWLSNLIPFSSRKLTDKLTIMLRISGLINRTGICKIYQNNC